MAITTVVAAYLLVVLGLNVLKYRARNTYFKEVLHELKAQNPSYYFLLPDHLKSKFEKRVFEFIRQKEFVPRGNLTEISTAMEVKIAVCATQLTFGLKPVYLSHFKSILIYPDRYYSTISKRYHCGEVNMRGCIVLSWKDFESGYHHANDGFNLGLHEMAHALHLENLIRNNEFNFLNKEYLQQWEQLSAEEVEISRNHAAAGKNNLSPFLRLQASTDEHEFFAVCVESFFERPKDFELTYPQLYQTLSRLLNQDPNKGFYQQVA